MRIVTFAKIPISEASEVIPNFLRLELIDRSAKISKAAGFRLVPVVEGSEDRFIEAGYELTEGPAYTLERRSPQERIMEDLFDLPDDIRSLLPMKWEYVGNIVVLKMDMKCDPYRERIGKVYAKILGSETVCLDSHGVSGEFRRPSMEIIYGTGTESIRLENGVRYFFDVSKVMFASGNTDERYRMRKQDCTGETVVDMFAGIGYFTLPLAKYSGARRIFACEKNPDSYGFLIKNIELNDVADVVIPILSDNRVLSGVHFADRVIMGYVQKTSEFLPKALAIVKKGGIIHYHDTFYVHEYRGKITEIFNRACGKGGFKVEVIHEVKSFAPSVSHYVADVRIL